MTESDQIIIQSTNGIFDQVCGGFRGALTKPPGTGIVQLMSVFYLSSSKVVKGAIDIVLPVGGFFRLFGLGEGDALLCSQQAERSLLVGLGFGGAIVYTGVVHCKRDDCYYEHHTFSQDNAIGTG